MTINETIIGNYLQISLNGRLDATWSDYVQDNLMKQIRAGHHHLLIDAENLIFLSSAGIRTLMIVSRELTIVKGTFSIIHPPPFVEKTIRLTGLGRWLADDLPDEVKGITATTPDSQSTNNEQFMLDEGPGMVLDIPARWVPWGPLTAMDLVHRRFSGNSVALGIGSASDGSGDALNTLGDFMAIAGHLVYQPPEKNQRPDYLIHNHDYVPEMQVVQMIEAKGKLTHHFRFAPDREKASFGIASLAEKALRMVKGRTAVVVVLAEIHGLVGASVTRSPGLPTPTGIGIFPEIRDWVSFTGEPMYRSHQCLVAGFVSNNPASEASLLKPLPANPGLLGHFHAAVFPYQSLPNGKIDLTATLHGFFNGPPPLALLHLMDDHLPIQGTGETTFIRGACWCAPAKSSEELS